MVREQNILEFINYNYIPFSREQCGYRILYVLLVSIALCLTPYAKLSWIIFVSIGSAFVCGVFVFSMVRLSNKKTTRFLCDGLYYFYLSVLLTILAYRINTHTYDSNGLVLVLYLLILLACIGLFLLLTFKNIKDGRFGVNTKGRKIPFLPYFFGFLGMVAARVFFLTRSEQQGLEVFSLVILLLALIVSVPSLNLLKYILALKMNCETEEGSLS